MKKKLNRWLFNEELHMSKRIREERSNVQKLLIPRKKIKRKLENEI
jgi:hypothetical protein